MLLMFYEEMSINTTKALLQDRIDASGVWIDDCQQAIQSLLNSLQEHEDMIVQFTSDIEKYKKDLDTLNEQYPEQLELELDAQE